MERHQPSTPIISMTFALVMVFIAAIVLQNVLVGPATRAAYAAPAPAPTLTPTITAPAPTYYNYSVKFVCGLQRPVSLGEPTVKPGNYATEIKIHNYMYQRDSIRKKVLVLVDPKDGVIGREPKQVQPKALDSITLGPDGATLDDCNRIWELLYPGAALPSPMPFMSGILVIISKYDLDVDAVYTASVHPTQPTGFGMGISEDVVRIPGKRVAIPNSQFPGGPIQ